MSNEDDHPAGIEAISVYVPQNFIEATEVAAANGTDPEKYTRGLGCRRMAIASPGEDAVTYGCEAARLLLERYQSDASAIGLLVVGTESGVDGSKPVAAYLHGMLGLDCRCRVFDTKHACYSATAALRIATDWCRGHDGRRGKALVVATDIARYDLGSPGEPTQGAAAVAMLVGNDAACMQLEHFPEAVYAQEVMDFWRPNYRHTAVVDGKVSLRTYLTALENTWDEYQRSSGLQWHDYEYLLFHVPFPRMAWKAFRLLHERYGNGESPEDAFSRMVEPGLWACRELGNCYSGSLYLCLAALLERVGQRATGARVGLFSYGSGCCAEFFTARIGSSSGIWHDRIGIGNGLRRRRQIDYSTYLEFRQITERMEGNHECQAGLASDADAAVTFCGTREHRRLYRFQAPTAGAESTQRRNSVNAQVANVLR